ncbi:MAG: peptidoglycan DD-metalloendopeptidase family protein [Methylocystaceae bacterium]
MKNWIKALAVALILLMATPTPGLCFMLMQGFDPAVEMQAAVAESGVRTYQVAKGETLWAIARRENLDFELIATMNNLADSDVLEVGQVINLPYQRSRQYQVQAGDNPWDIAQRYQVEVSALLQENHIRRPEALQVGQKLIIPGSVSNSRIWRDDSQEVSRGLFSSYRWPVLGVITCNFGWNRKRFHHGLDIAAPANTPIRAAAAGVVIFSGWKSVYGRAVIIEHRDGRQTLYGHARKLMVKNGQSVTRGQTIATVGSSGNSTGPHVHFEVRSSGKTKNPITYLSRARK